MSYEDQAPGTNGVPGVVRELIDSNYTTSPYANIEKLEVIGRKKAEAEGVAFQMDHERKILLARIGSEISTINASQNLSEAKLDRLSRADPRYANHIKGMAVAIENRERLRSDYWAVKSELEWDAHALHHYNTLSKLER